MLYFLSHPIQYFSPLFKTLAKDIDLEVCYYSDVSLQNNKDVGFGTNIKWDVPLLEGYKSSVLNNWRKTRPMNNQFWDVFNPAVIKKLWNTQHKVVVVNGWTYSSNWLVFLFGRLFGKEIWLRAESPLNQEIRKSPKVLFIKKVLLKNILFRYFVDKFLYIGTQNKEFYKYYGVNDESRLVFAPYAVDNDFFISEHERLYPNKADLRKELGLNPSKKLILYSGKFINKKRPLDLLKAFSNLPQGDYTLVFMGEGILRSEMESFIAQNDLKNVHLTGFVNQSQISKYYAIADVFVMCSGMGETWGLSVNEAMNFGLPVIVSETCGSSYDLVQNGVNGYVFKEGDVEELSRILKLLSDNPEFRLEMGKASLDIVQNYSYDQTIQNIKKELAII